VFILFKEMYEHLTIPARKKQQQPGSLSMSRPESIRAYMIWQHQERFENRAFGAATCRKIISDYLH
jgi:hypothetical protein